MTEDYSTFLVRDQRPKTQSKMERLFDPSKCLIPTAWCGRGPVPAQRRDLAKNIKYVREGTKDECLQKGFGAGVFSEKAKTLAPSSLQNIKYVGDVYERKFREAGIQTLKQLKDRVEDSTKEPNKALISRAVTKKNGRVDSRAYNHVLLWLYQNGVTQTKLPLCHKLTAESD